MLSKADYAGAVSGRQEDKPVLFEFPTYQYLTTGDVAGKCLSYKRK